MANYMGTSEAAERWGYTKATISKWCREGKIPNAEHDGPGKPWRIPVESVCPYPVRTWNKRKETE